MPTYDYQCNKCGETFEIFQSIKASPLRRARCETCGKSQPVKRLIGTGGAILFKGAGFYETDYKRKSGSRDGEAKPKDGEAKSSDSKNGSKAESKKETKTERKDSKSSEKTTPNPKNEKKTP